MKEDILFKEIKGCRICGNADLVHILSLGKQSLTSVFPKTRGQSVSSGPLELVKCIEDSKKGACGLLQLKHSFNPDEIYGPHYGYMSGINNTMVIHLQSIVKKILNSVKLQGGDVVLDIGSNDGTLLKAYPHRNITLLGIDPSGAKFKKYYPAYISLLVDYFSAPIVRTLCGNKKAKIITSIAMFYDLKKPLEFMQNIKKILSDDGVWVLEQSYMPTMLKQNAYDTICHEHMEYYGLRQIKWMTDRIGLRIIDVELNDINGGSLCIMVVKEKSHYKPNTKSINTMLEKEKKEQLDALKPYLDFKKRVFKHRTGFIKCVEKIKKKGQTILGYGASTKGNVILQFCGFTEKDIPAIAERNPEKYGCLTPGTKIPIIPEAEARLRNPDYLLALPWHFKEEFLRREKKYLDGGGKLLFPLPTIEIRGKQN